jgi:site-specific recombinase XerD
LSGQLEPLTYRTLLGLLACTGLRISEALALSVQDVDLVQGVLTVRFSKWEHSRLVPLHPSALSALRRYARRRTALFPQAQTFFISERGRRLQYGAVNRVFVGLSGDMVPPTDAATSGSMICATPLLAGFCSVGNAAAGELLHE